MSRIKKIKETVENNIVVWMLGTLLTGFLAGISTYEGAQKIMKLTTITHDRLIQLEELVLCPTANERSAQLEVYPAVNDT